MASQPRRRGAEPIRDADPATVVEQRAELTWTFGFATSKPTAGVRSMSPSEVPPTRKRCGPRGIADREVVAASVMPIAAGLTGISNVFVSNTLVSTSPSSEIRRADTDQRARVRGRRGMPSANPSTARSQRRPRIRAHRQHGVDVDIGLCGVTDGRPVAVGGYAKPQPTVGLASGEGRGSPRADVLQYRQRRCRGRWCTQPAIRSACRSAAACWCSRDPAPTPSSGTACDPIPCGIPLPRNVNGCQRRFAEPTSRRSLSDTGLAAAVDRHTQVRPCPAG